MVMSINFAVLFLSLIILFNNWGKNFASIYLAVSLTCLSLLSSTIQLVLHVQNANLLALFLVNAGPFSFLIGPFFFFFVRSILTNNAKLKKWDLLYFIPFFLCLIENIPYMFTSFDYKLSIANKVIQNPLQLKNIPLRLLIPLYWNNIMRMLYVGIFLTCSIVLLISNYYKVLNSKVIGKKKLLIKYKWILYFILAYCIITFNLLFVYYKFGQAIDNTWLTNVKTNTILNAIVYLTIPLCVLLLPEVLYGFTININTTNNKKTDLLDLDIKRLNNNFFNEHAYLNPSISLDTFAKESQIDKDGLELYIEKNEHLTFVDLVNKARVDYLCELLEDCKTDEYTIEALAKMSGFSSRQTMYLAFKRFKNTSPSEYLYNLKGS